MCAPVFHFTRPWYTTNLKPLEPRLPFDRSLCPSNPMATDPQEMHGADGNLPMGVPHRPSVEAAPRYADLVELLENLDSLALLLDPELRIHCMT